MEEGRKGGNAQFLGGDLLERVARVGVEHVEERLLAERLRLARTRCRRVHTVALRKVEVWLDCMRCR